MFGYFKLGKKTRIANLLKTSPTECQITYYPQKNTNKK